MSWACAECGIPLRTENPKARYCGAVCRSKKVREAAKAERDARPPKPCKQCGKPIPKDSGSNRKFCCAKCSAAFHQPKRERLPRGRQPAEIPVEGPPAEQVLYVLSDVIHSKNIPVEIQRLAANKRAIIAALIDEIDAEARDVIDWPKGRAARAALVVHLIGRSGPVRVRHPRDKIRQTGEPYKMSGALLRRGMAGRQ